MTLLLKKRIFLLHVKHNTIRNKVVRLPINRQVSDLTDADRVLESNIRNAYGTLQAYLYVCTPDIGTSAQIKFIMRAIGKYTFIVNE